MSSYFLKSPCRRLSHLSCFSKPQSQHPTTIKYFSTSTRTPWKDWLSQQSQSNPIHTLLKDKAYINGQWVSSDNNDTFEVRDPATQEIITRLPNMGSNETNNAINIASNAINEWKSYSVNQRCEIVNKIHILLQSFSTQLSHIMTCESGKPLNESLGEITYASAFFKWFSEEGKRTYGDIIPNGSFPNRRILITKEPVGLCGIITPWNFPAAMIARKLAPALAVGCSVVIKPASSTPLTALAIAEICEQAGVPNGVINIITSKKSTEIGNEICDNELVRKLSFTGSTNTGIILGSKSMNTMKRVSLELGGNAPFIIFNDANIDQAVNGALVAKYRNSGQTCVCTNRFYVHNKIKNEFVDKFIDKVKNNINVGHGFDNNIQQGPLISQNGFKKVEEHVKDAVSNGAEVVYGGNRQEVDGCEGGYFYQPTIIDGMTNKCAIAKEETFGPVAAIFGFDDEEEVINMANDTDAGLCSYAYTSDLNRAFRVSEGLQYGMVGINSGLISTEIAPFGGIKFSGLGREGSKYGIDEYLNIKYTCIDNVQ